MARLVLPSSKYKDSFIRSVEERQHEKLTGILRRYVETIESRNNLLPQLKNNFTHFLRFLKHSQNLIPGGEYPSQTTYWLIDKGEYLGTTSIRHWLTPRFRATGGHIGYVIRPSKRNQGYGKLILKLALQKARRFNIPKVLLTTQSNNSFSKKIILANGGIKAKPQKHHLPNVDYFWIKLT